MTVTYGGTTYYYATNLQGDVVAILDGSGTAVVTYTYDAWGNVLSTTGSLASTLGTHNPLRYRSYVYDTETGLYYLQSRYYDPSLGRFLNADAYTSTGQGILGNNMFAYCLNNPIVYEDSTGNLAGTLSPNTKLDEVKTYFDGGIGGGGVVSIAVATTVFEVLLDVVAKTGEWIDEKKDTLEKQLAAVDTVLGSRNLAVYYGADIYGGTWKIVTPAMDFYTAIVWVMTNALIGTYGKNASWGLYTANQMDALEMTIALGGPAPHLDINRPGEYPHFHPAGLLLFGHYRHFHIWYGSIYWGDVP